MQYQVETRGVIGSTEGVVADAVLEGSLVPTELIADKLA